MNYIKKICSNPLFAGISIEDISSMLSCLNAGRKKFEKGEYVFLAGDEVNFVYILLSGKIHILREDSSGRQDMIAEAKDGELFAEVFACANIKASPVSAYAAEQSEVLVLDYKKVISLCPSSCSFHSALISNMISILARKTLYLNRKLNIISKRTIRERIMAYLSNFDSSRVILPFNKTQFAAYLCVDRSALSTELSKMQKEGLIDINKNIITLK